ncbi:Uu.00g073250.m01.CDS01 [Anthostomella pinea]|uniref:Mediator of RNA polymerase II transcription subunit 18 n=1 Tax=Anthostomella pinea TaxID=933095 RepID=A0AAI8VW44_9PEZI|nr:Uu.00g073250.m01.CDS01 [Anthostomella pinea]
MHELFITAAVKADDFDMACAILQGLTWMTARRSVYRILFFAGLPQPKGLPNPRAFQMTHLRALWQELAKHLSRSSYVVQAAYPVSPDADFGKGTAMEFNTLPGTLRWTDLPDPWRDTPVISRKKLEIPEQSNLQVALTDNNYKYQNELVQESYSFVRGNVEFVFSRYYHLPDSPGRAVTVLPAWADLRPVDPAQKWVLNVKLNVPDDSQPDNVKKATEELMAVKAELDRMFDFKVVDRRVFDTRIAPPPIVPGRGIPK